MSITALRTKSKFHPDPEQSYTLPGTYYFDPDIYEREREEIFFKTWQFAGYLADLENPGDFITMDLLDQRIVIVRDRKRRLRAFYNVCAHRGHTLLEGKGNRRMITCPFHAWTYDLEGNLKAAGNSENVAGFDADEFCLSEVRVEEFLHMVFVNLDTGAATLESQAAGLAKEIRETVPNFDQLKFARRDTYEIKANWKFIFDQLECYHCPHLHPQVMGRDDSYMDTNWESVEHGIWATHIARGGPDILEKIAKKLPYDIGGQSMVKDVFIWYLWPNLFLETHHGPSNFKVAVAGPTGVEVSIRHMDHFCIDDPPTAYNIAQMDNHMQVAVPQDLKAMEMQQLGVHARGYTQGRLMVDKERSWQSEHGVHHFDNLVWNALHGDSYDIDPAA